MSAESVSNKPFCCFSTSDKSTPPSQKSGAPISPKQVEIPPLDLSKLSNEAKPMKKRHVKIKSTEVITIKQALKERAIFTIKEET